MSKSSATPVLSKTRFLQSLLRYMQSQPWCFYNGAFVLQDPHGSYYRFLLEDPKRPFALDPNVYPRVSTHLAHARKVYRNLPAQHPQFGLDIPPTRISCDPPANISNRAPTSHTLRTVLFFQLPGGRLFLKFEPHPCRGFLCLRSGRAGLRHAANYLATRIAPKRGHTRKEHGSRPSPNAIRADPRLRNMARDASYSPVRMAREVYLRQQNLRNAVRNDA